MHGRAYKSALHRCFTRTASRALFRVSNQLSGFGPGYACTWIKRRRVSLPAERNARFVGAHVVLPVGLGDLRRESRALLRRNSPALATSYEPLQYLTGWRTNGSVVENLPLSYVGGSSSNAAVPGGEGLTRPSPRHPPSGERLSWRLAATLPFYRTSVCRLKRLLGITGRTVAS